MTLQITSSSSGGEITIRLEGRLDSTTTGPIWRQAVDAAKAATGSVVDASGLTYCDISGVGLLVCLGEVAGESGGSFEIRGLSDEYQVLMDLFRGRGEASEGPEARRLSRIERLGELTWGVWVDIRAMVRFIGNLMEAAWLVLTRRHKIRWRDTLLVVESAGLNALPIILLMGFILGLIIAFQGAIPLRRYGGEILVADMVILAMFRELGPLFTAIMLTARSASAFAAELGTMKVSEEVDALKTMGIDPVIFLALPRVIAGVLVTPILAVFMSLAGLIGGGVVFLSLGFPANTYITRLLLRGDAVDFASGLVRAVVFGVIIACIGCMSGLQTGKGARAVGESTTRSVVSSLVLIIIADGVLAVIYNLLGI